MAHASRMNRSAATAYVAGIGASQQVAGIALGGLITVTVVTPNNAANGAAILALITATKDFTTYIQPYVDRLSFAAQLVRRGADTPPDAWSTRSCSTAPR